MMTLVLLRAFNVQLEDILQAFNQFTREAGDPTLLWVAEESVGTRWVRWIGEDENAIVEEVEDFNNTFCLGLNPEKVVEVEFISASSGSILRWTRNGYGNFDSLPTGGGVFEYQEGAPGYKGAYYRAFLEATA